MHTHVTQIYAKPQFSPEQLAAIAKLAKAMASLGIELLDTLSGDPDFEEDDPPEEAGDHLDAAWVERVDQCRIAVGGLHGMQFPGISEDAEDDDPGGCEHDGCEPDHDAEVETWSHWMDHPPELHIGRRPGHTDGPEAAWWSRRDS